MDIQQEMLLDGSTYEVLVDKKSVGPIVNVVVDSKKSVERNGDSIEGVMSVV